MSALPNDYDYDSDPERFLSGGRYPHDDVHPYVAARLARARARRVLDVGGGNGRLARLLPGLSMSCLLVDLSPVMLALAPRPVVRADGSRLPVADASVDAVAALYTLYHYADPRVPIREARRVLRPGGLLATCAPNRDSNPELATVLPRWGAHSTFDGEDAAAGRRGAGARPGHRGHRGRRGMVRPGDPRPGAAQVPAGPVPAPAARSPPPDVVVRRPGRGPPARRRPAGGPGLGSGDRHRHRP
jgi:SAM-dependent methyltransferase